MTYGLWPQDLKYMCRREKRQWSDLCRWQSLLHDQNLRISEMLLAHDTISALERTFLGCLRTSLALAFGAVVIAQLFRLEHTENPDRILGYFVLGIPLACLFLAAAIVVLLLGFYRFWRQQNAMLRGKIHAGGWEMNTIGLVVFFV